MTEQTDDTARRIVNSLLAETDQEMAASCRHTIRRLSIAAEAMQLAIGAVGDVPHQASLSGLPPNEILARWHGANLVLERVFAHLNFEVSNAKAMMRGMMPPR
jgi:hypothetical protein